MGSKSGECPYYNEDGTAIKILNYDKDVFDGEVKYFHKNGKLKKLIEYDNGQIDGVFQTFYKKGNQYQKTLQSYALHYP